MTKFFKSFSYVIQKWKYIHIYWIKRKIIEKIFNFRKRLTSGSIPNKNQLIINVQKNDNFNEEPEIKTTKKPCQYVFKQYASFDIDDSFNTNNDVIAKENNNEDY